MNRGSPFRAHANPIAYAEAKRAMTTHAPTIIREEVEPMPQYVDLRRLAREISWGESTIEAAVKAGTFPQPRKKCGKRVWKWKEVEEYLDAPDSVASPVNLAEKIRKATLMVSNG
jgi:predicted DNA-binding transcriptional regulator AlpA